LPRQEKSKLHVSMCQTTLVNSHCELYRGKTCHLSTKFKFAKWSTVLLLSQTSRWPFICN